MITILLFLTFHHTAALETAPTAETRFTAPETRTVDRGISHIRYPLGHIQRPVTLEVHPTISCLVEFSVPYTYIWASDQERGGNGGFFSYQQFGIDERGGPSYQRLLIKPVRESDEPYNIWLQVGDYALEIWVQQTTELAAADHRVYLDLRFPAKPIQRRVVPPEPVDKPSDEINRRLISQRNRTLTRKTFEAVYDRDHKPFLAFRVRGEAGSRPEVQSLEIVRGKKLGWGSRARFRGYPIESDTRVDDDGNRLLTWQLQNLDRGEHLYVRVQYEGQSTPRYYRLKASRGHRCGG